ncbi:hypothetical protein BT96DRAFT_435003 [Gymnopus androsaceus JB14]|uniref:Uncharacterized protein n=1 Tax=Gymnopus androsaceus JB14 TaxID=1447944 RepID=A0A6A4I680_9AGAR|nr:hypothetical protein BT96DRAFT_435003 [Gymnopus androsaceus JB14]
MLFAELYSARGISITASSSSTTAVFHGILSAIRHLYRNFTPLLRPSFLRLSQSFMGPAAGSRSRSTGSATAVAVAAVLQLQPSLAPPQLLPLSTSSRQL